MTAKKNTQLFALSNLPASELSMEGASWRLVKVFKHDFFAATCLYELVDGVPPCGIERVVVKFGRTQPFFGLSMKWYGQLLRRHEHDVYARLKGIAGVPRWVGCVSDTAYAIEYIDALPLDHLPVMPEGFFDKLHALMTKIHSRGVGYCDANKKSNILVRPDGSPCLIDYQISLMIQPRLIWPLRNLIEVVVKYVQNKDIYHIFKHKRRLCPHELRSEEVALSYNRTVLHRLHRTITKPYRAMRRRFLSKQHTSGRLVSPTQDLEDHHQPEKQTWRAHKG